MDMLHNNIENAQYSMHRNIVEYEHGKQNSYLSPSKSEGIHSRKSFTPTPPDWKPSQEDNSFSTDTTALTPGQLALLYKTLQCDVGDGEQLLGKMKEIGACEDMNNTYGIRNGVEKLIISSSTSRKSFGDSILQRISNLHKVGLVESNANLGLAKQRFWDTMAAKIQALWKGYVTRMILNEVIGSDLSLSETKHIVAPHMEHSEELNSKSSPKPRRKFFDATRSTSSKRSSRSQSPRRRTSSFASQDYLLESPSPFPMKLSISDKHFIKFLYYCLGGKDTTLKVCEIISALRLHRSKVHKTSTDKLIDVAIHGFLQMKLCMDASVSVFSLIEIVENSLSSSDPKTGNAFLELSYKLWSESLHKRHPDGKPMKGYSLSKQEVAWLRYFFLFAFGSHEAHVTVDKLLNELLAFCHIPSRYLPGLLEHFQNVGPDICESSYLARIECLLHTPLRNRILRQACQLYSQYQASIIK